MAKREPKPLKSGGHFILDASGNKVPVNPKEIPSIANACAAAVKTMETGQMWRAAQ